MDIDVTRLFPLYDTPGHLIRRLNRKMGVIYEQQMADTGLTPPQMAILWGVALAPDLEQSELAGLLSFDAATAGAVLARLVKAGLVQRAKSKRSRRGWVVRLTPEGEARVALVKARIEQMQEQVLGGLSREERDTVLRLMSRMAEANNSFHTPEQPSSF